MTNESTPTIFIAYSHKDKEHLEELRTFISPLIRSKKVNIWFDGEIRAGAVWDVEIKKALHSADIILLLVSPNSLNSDYFYEKEVEDALERHGKNEARVIPIILNPCLWDDTPLHEIQVLPKGAKPISEWLNKNSAWDDVARGIKNSVYEINNLKNIAEQKRIEFQKLKEKQEQEAEIKATEERIRIEKENKIKEFYAAIEEAERLEKIERWEEVENVYRKSLSLWESPVKPSKDKILIKITNSIAKQNAKLDSIKPDTAKTSSNTSENIIVEHGYLRRVFWPSILNREMIRWIALILLGIFTLYWITESNNALSTVKNQNNLLEKQIWDYSGKYPIIIDHISATITDGKGNDLLQTSSQELIADSVQWLSPVIEYRAHTSYYDKKLLIKIINPDGTIMKGPTSPEGGSYEYDISVYPQQSGKRWERLGGWGNDSRTYVKGYYRIEVWYQNACLGGNTIILK